MIKSLGFEIFIFLGSIIEEIFPPFPSPLIVIITKMSTSPNSYSLLYLVLIAGIATIGKTFGAFILYVLGDKGEDIIVRRFGRILGISHKGLEKIGKKFSGSWKDIVILLILRILPIIPTTPFSFMCEFIKLNLKTFIYQLSLDCLFELLSFLYWYFSSLITFVSNNIYCGKCFGVCILQKSGNRLDI